MLEEMRLQWWDSAMPFKEHMFSSFFLTDIWLCCSGHESEVDVLQIRMMEKCCSSGAQAIYFSEKSSYKNIRKLPLKWVLCVSVLLLIESKGVCWKMSCPLSLATRAQLGLTTRTMGSRGGPRQGPAWGEAHRAWSPPAADTVGQSLFSWDIELFSRVYKIFLKKQAFSELKKCQRFNCLC